MLSSKHSFKLLSKKKIKQFDGVSGLEISKSPSQAGEAVDNNKRSFLKTAGVISAGALAFSLLPKKAEALVFGSKPVATALNIKNSSNQKINPATDGKLDDIIVELKKKVNSDGTQPVSISGTVPVSGTVAVSSVAGTVPVSVAETVNVTLSGNSVVSGAMGVKDSSDVRVNPVQDDTVVLLRRMVKLMESQATVDAANRQRVSVDSMGAGLAATTSTITVPVTLSGSPTVTLSSQAVTLTMSE